MHKGRVKGLAQRGHELSFGNFGIKSLEPGWITSRQIEAARIAMTRAMKREGQVWIRIFPDKPITKKPAEVRMGKGKGAPEYWVAVIKPGTILFEATGVSLETAQEALRLAQQKLPVSTRFVVRRDYAEYSGIMKNAEIRSLAASEIAERIVAEQENLSKLKFAHAISPIENPNRIRESKRFIARLKTALVSK